LKEHLDMTVLAAPVGRPAHGYGIIQEIKRRSGVLRARPFTASAQRPQPPGTPAASRAALLRGRLEK
jgi:hypothetical protein